MAQVYDEQYKAIIEPIFKMDLPLQDKISLAIQELCEFKDENNDGIADYRTIAKAVIEIFSADADYYFDADEWDFTTEDESLVLDDGLTHGKTGIVRLGRMKRLPDEYVIEVYNEENDEYERKRFSTFEEATKAYSEG